MSLSPGTTVGRYQVQSLLGSGGMGDVYKALDATLGRPVALKVLRRELSVDPERLGRFLHEARAASALNHPNILTIHEVGDHDAARFLVSEFVEGETVRQRLERGSLTLREILDIGIQTASALSAAHAASIVHRDIKPDNLMLRPDGYVKVLDFGVATFLRQAAGSADALVTMAATVETSPGTIIGTIAYMSPEQARGLAVDGRSDCYSLGVVLYELVTGRAPFVAPTTSDLLVAILEREPPSLRLAARALPPPLEWIIEKALEKDPNLRYQSIADLRVDLQRLKTAMESGRVTGQMSISEARRRRCAARARPDCRQPGGRLTQRTLVAQRRPRSRGHRDAGRGDVLLPSGAARRRPAAPTAIRRGGHESPRCHCRLWIPQHWIAYGHRVQDHAQRQRCHGDGGPPRRTRGHPRRRGCGVAGRCGRLG